MDIRSEAPSKLLAEFLGMNTPYIPGEGHVDTLRTIHPPCFTHITVSTSSPEIYCYFLSPYRDRSISTRSGRYAQPPQCSVHLADHPFVQSMIPHKVYTPPPSYEGTRRCESGPSGSQSPGLR